MRTANVVVTVLGTLGALGGLAMAVRWRDVPLVADRPAQPRWKDTTADAVRTWCAVIAAGVIAGVLVLGLAGRLVMRLLAATSGGDAQGRLTEAGERVGAITTGGTVGFLVFVGVLGGVFSALVYLPVRRWLPRTAGRAGLVAGVILVGTLGVLDPLSPDNVDFDILGPTWLAITAVVATGLLFASSFVALAARLDHVVSGRGRGRWAPCAALPVAMVPPVALYAIAYVGGRTLARGRAARVLARPAPMATGRTLVGAATVLTLVVAAAAGVRIALA